MAIFSVTSPQTSDSTVTITRVAELTLADASNFSVGDPITCDGDGGNDAVGEITAISGNEVTVSVTSGTFVVSNGVDNVTPYNSDETTISSIDSEYFLIEKLKIGTQLNNYVIYIDYTKSTETGIDILCSTKDTDLIDKYFNDSYVPATGIAVPDTITIQATSCLKLIQQISMSEEYMQIKLTPEDIYTSGTVNIAIGENNLHT